MDGDAAPMQKGDAPLAEDVYKRQIPYGAQMLVAISAAAELGYAVSAFQIMPFLFYPFLLLASSLVFIFLVPDKRGHESEKA